ncbi:MAG TPA: PHP domain-containing protein [Gemmataceae bacterium]|nr:PHP domain-containing protein [Gemmataceae bacterium]
MPARQPFTALCQLAARQRLAGRADLHVHTTHSDGAYTPAQVVELARRAGLAAVAVTDHDAMGGVAAARTAAEGSGVEVAAGVEITAEFRGRELHLLGYFFDTNDGPLTAALEKVRRGREERFRVMVERLRTCGASLDLEREPPPAAPEALGRRHLAVMLVRQGLCGSVREAFARWLRDGGRADAPKRRLPVGEAAALVRTAGGVAAYAHPPYDCTVEDLAELRELGLGAVEVDYPAVKASRSRELRAWAAQLGLAVSAGSDCHGPGKHAIGACTVSTQELDSLRPK